MFVHGVFNLCNYCRSMENRFSFQEALQSTHIGVLRNAVCRESAFFLRHNHMIPACFTKEGIQPETIQILTELGIQFSPNMNL